MTKNNRPTFYYKNNENNPIRAGGIIYYRIVDNNNIEFLMIKKNDRYEDFGGKTESFDDTYLETVAREANEESNGIIIQNEVYKHLDNIDSINSFTAYSLTSKYILFICPAAQEYDPIKFDMMEYKYNLKRNVEWVNAEDFLQTKYSSMLHRRLRFTEFFDIIRQLKDNNKYKT